MGRHGARHAAVLSHRAAGGGDGCLGSLSFAGHSRPDLLLFSMGRFAFRDRFRRDFSDSLGFAAVVYKPAAANGDMAFPFPDLSIDAGVWSCEVVEQRFHLAKSDGIELSLRDPASADTARVVRASSAGICAEVVGYRSVWNRTGGAVFVFDHAVFAEDCGAHDDCLSMSDRLYRELHVLQSTDDRFVRCPTI